MQRTIDSLTLKNNKSETIRIYEIDDNENYCLQIDEEGKEISTAAFQFNKEEANEIIEAINMIVYGETITRRIE